MRISTEGGRRKKQEAMKVSFRNKSKVKRGNLEILLFREFLLEINKKGWGFYAQLVDTQESNSQ